MIHFFVPMKPKAKQGDRSRIAKSRSGKEYIIHYKDKDVVRAEDWFLQNAKNYFPEKPLDKALFVYIIAHNNIPKSFSKKKRAMAIDGSLRPTGKPDVDNIAKFVLDAMGITKRFFKNDSQVVKLIVSKLYDDEREGLEIQIGEL